MADDHEPRFEPARDIRPFIDAAILDEAGPLYNPEHSHLAAASIGFLWTNTDNRRRGRAVVGEAEQPNFKGGRWQIGRQKMQMTEWFGDVPEFVITLNAGYVEAGTEVEFLALLEHELYHCGQALDLFGFPKFTREGRPVFAMRGHDIEEFTGIVRRYGIGAAGQTAVDFVAAAAQDPEVSPVRIAALCGTCSV